MSKEKLTARVGEEIMCTPPDARVVSLRRNRTAVTLWLPTGSWLPGVLACRRAPFQPCVFCVTNKALSRQMLCRVLPS